MYAFRILIFSLVLFSSSFALTFSLTTNVGADVSFSSGNNTHTVQNTTGGKAQDVTLSWVTSQMNVTITARSRSVRHNDTTFVRQMGSNTNYPAWTAQAYPTAWTRVSHNGKVWENRWWADPVDVPGVAEVWREVAGDPVPPVVINLSAKPLPTDTAFIPVFSNRDANIEISSSVFNGTRPVRSRILDTLLLPLTGDGTAIGQNLANRNVTPARLVSMHGRHLLTLSQNDYKNAEIRVVGINGRVISSNKLSGVNQTSITTTNVAAGVYVLSVRGINGANFTSKIMHSGGDFRLATSFNGDFEIGGIANSRIIRTAEPRSVGVPFRLTFRSQTLGDTTININAVGGQINEPINIRFFDPNALPSENFEELLSREQYERMFPNRFGFGRAVCANATANVDPNCSKNQKNNITGNDGTYDFYSYDALLGAIDLMGAIKVDYEFGRWSGLFKMTWTNKRTGDVKVITHPRFYQEGGAASRVQIDYADYCNKGDLNTRKRELAASLAHVSQETGGFGLTGDIHYHWGLYWREEAGFHSGSRAYQSPDPLGYYNANPAKSYHGRGPKQLTHPYNYGPFSEFLYGDRFVLINNPDAVLEDGKIAWASAIWFWMTPQPPKPSSHNVMIGNFTDADVGNKPDRRRSPFGWTISIINGGFECGAANDGRARNRIEYYKRYMQILGTSDNTADFGCFDMN